jgi:hypothetical protein
MAEPERIDEQIFTRDLAGSGQTSHEIDERSSLLRRESRRQPESASPLLTDDEVADSRPPIELPAGDRVKPLDSAPVPNNAAVASTQAVASNPVTPLFSEPEVNDFRSRWNNIQTGFVDEPREAVKDADQLVASLMKKLADGFANEREGLEHQWDRGDTVSTEDLRIALQRYRSFFDRLLKI